MLFLCRPVATLHCRFLCGAATVVLVPVAVAVAAVPLGGCGCCFFVHVVDSGILQFLYATDFDALRESSYLLVFCERRNSVSLVLENIDTYVNNQGL